MDRATGSQKIICILLAVATLLAFFSTAQAASYLSYAGRPVPWAGLLKARFTDFYLYLLFVPFLYRAALAWPIDAQSWRTALPLQMALGLLCGLVKSGLFTLIGNWSRPGVFGLQQILALTYVDAIVILWTIIAAVHVYVRWRGIAHSGDPAIERFTVSGTDGYRLISVDQVEWIEAQGNYVRLNTTAGRHMIRETISSLERRLGEDFVRVHRSAIVNRSRIERIRSRSHGAYSIMLASGAEIATARSYNDRLRALIF